MWNRKSEYFESVFDLDDFDKVDNFPYKFHVTWKQQSRNYYVEATKYLGMVNGKPKYKAIQLHRLVLGVDDDKIIDHINHDTFDNRKENLRITTKDKNSSHRRGANKNNSTGYRNISYIKSENIFKVQIMKNGNRYIKDFEFLEDAIEYANNKRKELFGDFYGSQ